MRCTLFVCFMYCSMICSKLCCSAEAAHQFEIQYLYEIHQQVVFTLYRRGYTVTLYICVVCRLPIHKNCRYAGIASPGPFPHAFALPGCALSAIMHTAATQSLALKQFTWRTAIERAGAQCWPYPLSSLYDTAHGILDKQKNMPPQKNAIAWVVLSLHLCSAYQGLHH